MKKIISILGIFLMLMVLNVSKVSAKANINTPKNVKASISGVKNVKVKWSKVSGASKYKIYRATSKKGKYKKVGSTTTTSYKDKSTTRGKTYYYKVVATKGKQNSKKSSYVKIKVLSKAKILKKIRKELKDKNWVKKNLKMKETVFGEKFSSGQKQVLTFEKIKGKELVVVEAMCDEALTSQVFIVGYNNGKVVAKPISEYKMHTGHSGASIDAKKGMVWIGYMHMGYCGATFYKASNVKFTEMDSFSDNESTEETPIYYELNSKKVSKKKYYDRLNAYQNKYSWGMIEKKLNEKNIDKYIK